MVHQIDGIRNGLGLTAVVRIQGRPQDLLGEHGKGLALLPPACVEHLGAAVPAVRIGVLMDAEQHGVLRVLNPGRPVVEIRHLLLPQGIGVRVVKGDVLTA